jgi:protein-S-isoprenylcysteine O-methyltransferase Ste14
MSAIPAFEIGVWNAWILLLFFFLSISIPDLLMSKEAKEKTKRATASIPFSRTYKILALSTHAVIMPVTFIYSIFLPIKLDIVWLCPGLIVYILALLSSLATSMDFASTPIGEPVTRGVYRISRHPIYLSGFLLYVSIGLACASWVFILFAVLWIAIWNIVVPAEERFLLEKYGELYREYINNTPRWIGLSKSGKK